MINKKNQDYQVKPSKRFDDEFATGQTLETKATSLEDDLNALRTQIRRITGRENWYDNSNFPSRTDLNYFFSTAQATWSTVYGDTGETSPDRRKDTLIFEGGYGVSTTVAGKQVNLSPAAEYYSVYTDGSNSVSPASSTDTLRLVGASSNITVSAEEVDGDKRAVIDYTGPGRQDLWYRIIDDDGQSIAPTSPADTLEIVGENSITASISANTLTISYPQDLSTGATPTFANVRVASLDENGVVFIDDDNYVVNDPSKLYFDPTNDRLGIGTNAPEENLHIEDGNFLHTRDEAVVFVNEITDAAFVNVQRLHYHKGFVYLSTGNTTSNRFYAINVLDETAPEIASYLPLTWASGDSSVGDFVIAGKYAYVCKATSLHVIDIEDPYRMTEVGYLSVATNDLQIPVIFGNTLICIESDLSADTGTTLHVVDISDPQSPVLLYSDTTLSDYDRVRNALIRGNRLFLIGGSGSGTGYAGIFDLSDIEKDTDFSLRLINQEAHILGTNGSDGVFSTGNSLYLSDRSRDVVVYEVAGDLGIVFESDFGEGSGTYWSLVRGGTDSFYLLRDEDIVTVKRNGLTSISNRGTYSEPSGYDALCGDYHADRLYVYHSQSLSGGGVAIYECGSDVAPLVEAQRASVDVFEARNMVIEGDLSVRDSLNVGPEGVFVDQGHGISVDSKVTAQGKVGLGHGAPRGDLHVGGGRLHHRANLASAVSVDAIPYAPTAIYADGNLLYVLSAPNDNITIWDVDLPNDPKEIEEISLPGATFPSNIVVIGNTLYYAKTNNVFGVTRLSDSGNTSNTITLDSGTIIRQTIVFGKYACLASNGTNGQSVYVIDVSDPSNLVKVGEWKVTGFSDPTDGIEIGYMHKNGDVLILYGSSPSFSNTVYNLNISDPTSPTLINASASSASTVTTGYSISDMEVVVARGATIQKITLRYSDDANVSTTSTTTISGNVGAYLVLGQTLYVGTSTGLETRDIDSLEVIDTSTVLGNLPDNFSLAATKRNLFAITNSSDLAYLDLKTYEGTSTKAGVVETDFMISDAPMEVRKMETSGLETYRVMNESNLGIVSFSDLTVLGNLTVLTETENTNYAVNINQKDVRHQSSSLYDEVETQITELNTNTVAFKYHDDFLYALNVGSSQAYLYVISTDSKDSPDAVHSISLGSTVTYEPTAICFSGIYCYVLYSDGKLTIIDISHPVGASVVSSRVSIGSASSIVDCYARGSDLYMVDSGSDLHYMDVSDPTSPLYLTTVALGNTPLKIVPSNHELCVVFDNGLAQIYDISNGSPSEIGDDSFSFSSPPVDVKSYGDMIFALYNSSGAIIKAYRRSTDTLTTLTPETTLGTPKKFEVFENGFVILTNQEISVALTDTDGFTGASLKVFDQVTLDSGAELANLFLSLTRKRAYVVTTINSKLFSYDIGQLRVSGVNTEALSSFNLEVRDLHSIGSLSAHSMMIGPGGLNVASSNGIRVDGNLQIAGNSSFGATPNSDKALTLTEGNLSLVKTGSSTSKTLSLGGGVTIAGAAYKGPYFFLFTSEDEIACYISEDYANQVEVGTLSINTADFKDAQIVGDYLYFLNGDTFSSTVNIVDISNPENMVLVGTRSWNYQETEQLEFFDMSKLLVVGDLMFIVAQADKGSIVITDISDKTNVKYIKSIKTEVIDVVDMATNGSHVFAISNASQEIYWISLDSVLEDDLFIPLRVSGSGALSNPTKCKVFDNVLFVANSDASASVIDIFETVGEAKSKTGGLGVIESGDLIGQITVSANINDFYVGSEELVVLADAVVQYYQMVDNYTVYATGSVATTNGFSIDFYKDQVRVFEPSASRMKIFQEAAFKNLSVTASSCAYIGDSLIKGRGSIANDLTAHFSLNVGGFGFETKGDLVVGRDLYTLGGFAIGSFSKDYDIYWKNKSFIFEKNKTPQPDGSYDIAFVAQVISSDDFFIPDPGDDAGGGGSATGGSPTTANDIMNGPRAIKRVGNYLFVVANDEGLTNDGSLCALDASTPKAPYFCSAVQDAQIADCFDLDVQDSYAYVISPTVVAIYDVNRKEAMTLINSVTSASFTAADFPFDATDQTVLGTINDILVRGKYAFVACTGANFLVVFDIEDPNDIKIVAAANSEELGLGVSADADNMHIEGNKLYVSLHTELISGYSFDISEIDSSPNMQPIGTLSIPATPDSISAIASSGRYFFSIDNGTEDELYVQEIVNELPESVVTSLADAKFNVSNVKMIAKNEYLYVMTNTTFSIYKLYNETLILWADYDTSQNPTSVGVFSDMEIAGRNVYITDQDQNRVLVLDVFGLLVDHMKVGYLESNEMVVQQGLRGVGSLNIDGNVFVGNSVFSSGPMLSSIVQTDALGQKGQALSSPLVFALEGSIDVGDSTTRIPSSRIFEQTSLQTTSGRVQKTVVYKDIIYLLKNDNKLYAIDVSSETPEHLGEIQRDGSSFLGRDFAIKNDNLFILEFDSVWKISQYKMEDRYQDFDVSEDQIASVTLSGIPVADLYDKKLELFDQYVVIVAQDDSGRIIVYLYDIFSRSIIYSQSIATISTGVEFSVAIRDGVLYVSNNFDGIVYYVDLNSLPNESGITYGTLLITPTGSLSNMVVKDNWMYVSVPSEVGNAGEIRIYELQRTSIPKGTFYRQYQYGGTSVPNSLGPCPDPKWMAIVGDVLFVVTHSDNVSVTDKVDYSTGLCAFRLIEDQGQIEFLYKINDFSITGEPNKVFSCGHFLALEYNDNPNWKVFLLKPTTAKTVGGRFQTLTTNEISSQGDLQVTGRALIGSLEAHGDIMTRGQAVSSWGISGQLYGFRKLENSIEIAADQTYNFENIGGVSYAEETVGQERGLAWSADHFTVYSSGKYELIFSGAINHDTSDVTIILDFNGVDTFPAVIEANQYTSVSASYVFDVVLDESASSEDIQLSITVSGGSALENFRVAKGSILLLRKIG